MDNEHKILLTLNRNGFIDNTFYGSYYLFKDGKIIDYYGCDPNSICFLRSLAKPLQASILCDSEIINEFCSKDLAIFEASHAASPIHIEHLKKLIKKYKLKISDFNLEKQAPLDLRKFNGIKTKLHNNCSGKHLMMLIFSKYSGFSIKDYQKEFHPIQKLIKKKQETLSEYKSDILTFDGCGTPLWGLPYKNTLIAYSVLVKNHKILIDSAIKNSYIFGGYDRLDSEIINLGNKNLFAKVGAGGFLIVYNLKEDMFLLLKLTQNNNPIRKMIAFDMLNKLGWANIEPKEFEINQQKEKVGKYIYKFCC